MALKTHPTGFQSSPTVWDFLQSDDFVRIIMGPIGSGKSSACAIEGFKRAGLQQPGPDGVRRTRGVVVRNTYPQLRDTARKTFEDWIPLRHKADCTWREQEFTFELRSRDVHMDVLFRALDKPQDIKKLLSLELTWAWLNEVRELPKHVFDQLQGRVGRYPPKRDGGATWFGIWGDTNPPHKTHWLYDIFEKQRPSGFKLFKQPGGMTPNAENAENLPNDYYQRLCAGKDKDWVRVYVDGDYAHSDTGSIYGEWIEGLQKRDQIVEFSHPLDGVFTTWDLGISDHTAIWFWRIGANRLPEVVDFYETSGKALGHFFDVIDRKGYDYVKHWLPHDARARTLQTGVSTLEQFIERYGADKVSISPQLAIHDGISAARWIMEKPIKIHTRCADGLDALNAYRFEWDETNQVFSKNPVHNFASHAADAWRYLACVFKASDLFTQPEHKATKPAARAASEFSLDELFEWRENDRA